MRRMVAPSWRATSREQKQPAVETPHAHETGVNEHDRLTRIAVGFCRDNVKTGVAEIEPRKAIQEDYAVEIGRAHV